MSKEKDKDTGPTVTYYLDGFEGVRDVSERLKLVLDDVCMAEPKVFRARCNVCILGSLPSEKSSIITTQLVILMRVSHVVLSNFPKASWTTTFA